MVSSPTTETLENTLDSNATLSIPRRSSSGGLTSPEGELRNGAGGQEDGFYMLKKDSERRMTLNKVLTQDEVKICDDWMNNIYKELGESILKKVS